MQLSKSETPFSQGTAVHWTVWDQKENVRPPIQSPLCSWLLALWASPTGPRGNEDPRHPLCPHRPSAETSTLIKSPDTSSCHLCAWSKWRAEHTGSDGWPCLHSFLGEERANCSRVIRNPTLLISEACFTVPWLGSQLSLLALHCVCLQPVSLTPSLPPPSLFGLGSYLLLCIIQ